MNNNEPQYETMPEHYVLCFNDECALVDKWYVGNSDIPLIHEKIRNFRFFY